MPIRKLQKLPDVDESVWLSPDDPRLWRTIKAVWALSARLCPPRFPSGVYKHRTIEDANRQTEAWERDTLARQNEPSAKLLRDGAPSTPRRGG
jgi:hypothetical protein